MGAALEINDRDSWLRERQKGIGASEVGTILGLNPYESPYELYLHKRGEIPAKDETLPMWLGHEMEPIIAKRYELETDRKLNDPGEYTILEHPEYPWLRATLDRTAVIRGHIGPVELKAPGSDLGGAWEAFDAPLVYQAQLQIQMACMGASMGEIAALVGNKDFYVIEYARNDNFLASVIPEIHEFWERVQTGNPPPVDGSESTRNALRKLHPFDNGNTTELPAEFGDKIQKWQGLKVVQKKLDEEIRQFHNEFVAALGHNTFGIVDGMKLSYKAQTRKAYSVDETTCRVLRKVGK